MSRYDIEAARRAIEVPWSAAREEELLGRLHASGKRRARRRQVATWAGLALAVGLTFHWASRVANGFPSGIAGTGGDGSHGRASSTGIGGSAGTG
jgi:hypothetical protein